MSDVREEVFQLACLGKYQHNFHNFLPDDDSLLRSPTCSAGSTSSQHGQRLERPLPMSGRAENSYTPASRDNSCGIAGDNDVWLYFQNVRGLRTKIDDLVVAVCDCNYDVIILIETGLDDSINSLQLFGTDFNVFRCDRSARNSQKAKFGGVLIAVASVYKSVEIKTINGSNLEQVSVSACIRGKRFVLCAVYIPPDRSRDVGVIDAHLATLRELRDATPDGDLLLACGDYNQPHIAWDCLDDGILNLDPSTTSAASAALMDGTSFLNIRQYNSIRNHLGRILDLVFCDSDCNIVVNEAVSPLLAIDLHHPPILFSLPTQSDCVDRVESLDAGEHTLDYSKIDFVMLNEFLMSCDWSSILATNDVNDMAAQFCNIICNWLTDNTPRRKPPISPAWSSPLLRLLKRDKNSWQRKLRRHRTSETKRNFHRACNAYRKLNSTLYKSYVLRVQTNLRRNPKSFWKFVNSKRKSSNIPSSVFFGDLESTSMLESCDLFSRHFSSVFSDSAANADEVERAACNVPEGLIDLRTFVVSNMYVVKAVRKLKKSVSPGPDGVPAIIFCRCVAVLADPLARIFTASLHQGVFPEIWRHSFMFPVHKKGDKRDVTNYRGITSLSAASKLFEIIVNDAIFFHVKSYISATQHGFMPGRSVTSNLLEFTSTCINHLENRAQVDTVYTDLKAAFDCIDHGILLRKMSRLGISDGLVDWLKSYLSNRTLRVKLGSCTSSPFAATSGVPQGSNLGPLLFTIFFNDVTLLLPSGCVLIYADDLKLYIVVKNVEDCRQLQAMLDQFVDWCRLNKLSVSISKCVVMTFNRTRTPIVFDYSIDGFVLERVEQVSDLGVMLDPKLTFDLHRSMVITKANRQLGFISRISRDFSDPYCLKALYCSLVRPIIETASVVWTPYQLSWNIRIERIQKTFIRRALRQLPWRDPLNLPPYAERCRLLSMDTLQRRRQIQQATFVAKLLSGEIDSTHLLSCLNFRAPSRFLRSTFLLRQDSHRSSFGQHEPVTSMIRTFSTVEELFEFGEPAAQFQRRIINSRYI